MDLLPWRLAVVAVVLAVSAAAAEGFNITKILGEHPEYSQFNKLLTQTRLAGDINRGRTITVLAVANDDIGDLTSGHYSLGTLRHILELHVIVDYFDEKKLKQLSHAATAASTMFQRSGAATDMNGYVNITQHRGGKVTFIADGAADGATPSTFVGDIYAKRFDYAVLHVSKVLSSPEAEAPVAPPAPINLTDLLSKKYCKSFAGLVAADADAFSNINATKDTALTLFCPVDAAVASFMPKFKNLTAKAKTAILLYHAVPDYYSMQLLKSNNGKVTTLATTSVAKKDYSYDVQSEADTVTLDTKVTTSSIQATVRDDDPLAVYAISKFLQPKELFKVTEDLASAPAPEEPKKKTKKKPTTTSAAAAPSNDESADSPVADSSADDDADKAGATPSLTAWWMTAAATVAAALALAA
ncbi:fasciclin-like arabinogalactan protein 2 [Phragmites australis]|uniref:fasciclin-like arabinogalactan protein 2 n=1 Tax=Phragmites australis TaxID=29695 RepID=UPI002D786723|nr:fasciclin-like arabinogalactan protein 2 [Phragmites australis]